jgi:hypothetical protein
MVYQYVVFLERCCETVIGAAATYSFGKVLMKAKVFVEAWVGVSLQVSVTVKFAGLGVPT